MVSLRARAGGAIGLLSCNEPGLPPEAPGAAAVASPPTAPAPPLGAPLAKTVILEGYPFVRQKPDFCGEACAEMALRRLGKSVDQDAVFDVSGVDPALARGATTRELKTALEALGFRVGEVWYSVDAQQPGPGLDAQLAAVHADLERGVPSILCMHYGDGPGSSEHFRLVVGYDAATDEIVYQEPAEDGGGYRRMARATLFRRWPLPYRDDRWTVIRFRLEPGELRTPPPRAGISPAALAQHMMELKKRVPRGFTVVIEPPFVVIGDDAPAVVRARAEDTVRWAVSRLKADFFATEPRKVLDIWLFKDGPSYRDNALALFGERPTTPYGYYSSAQGALVMNISTGGGTLVHEIVHPFVEADLPGAPPWLNEGLGSLFEQSADEGGHIVGRTNWRLAGLQAAIRAGRVPSFKELTDAKSRAFYDDDPGTNYAQSRYLLYYLQEQGLLTRFYREARAAHAADPTGYETLKRVLGEPDMDAFKPRWEEFVLGLRF